MVQAAWWPTCPRYNRMDVRLSSLPYSAQAAVRDARKGLDDAQRMLARKKGVNDRAARYAERAGERIKLLRLAIVRRSSPNDV